MSSDSANEARFQEEMDRANAEREVNWKRKPARSEAEKAARTQEVQDAMNRMRMQRASR